jgi:hypothetical protein
VSQIPRKASGVSDRVRPKLSSIISVVLRRASVRSEQCANSVSSRFETGRGLRNRSRLRTDTKSFMDNVAINVAIPPSPEARCSCSVSTVSTPALCPFSQTPIVAFVSALGAGRENERHRSVPLLWVVVVNACGVGTTSEFACCLAQAQAVCFSWWLLTDNSSSAKIQPEDFE